MEQTLHFHFSLSLRVELEILPLSRDSYVLLYKQTFVARKLKSSNKVNEDNHQALLISYTQCTT